MLSAARVMLRAEGPGPMPTEVRALKARHIACESIGENYAIRLFRASITTDANASTMIAVMNPADHRQ